MNCQEFRSLAVHALLGKAPSADVEACRAHVRACADCAAASRGDAYVVELLRSQRVPQTSAGFRKKLAARFEAEIAHGSVVDSGVYLRFTFRERLEAQAAWIGYRLRTSRPLQALAAAAGLLLATFGYLRWADGEGHGGPREIELVHAPRNVAPVDREALEEVRRDDPFVPAEVASSPPDRVGLDPAELPVAPEIDDEPTVENRARQLRELELENRFVLQRFKMRDRFNTGGAVATGRDDVDRAVLSALRWLVEQQDADGGFDPQYFGGLSALRVGTTGLATLALLTNADRGVPGGVYRDSVARAVKFLRESRNEAGTFGEVTTLGERDYEYTLFNHAVATIALAEHRILLGEKREDALLGDALLRLSDLSRRREMNRVRASDATTAPWVALAFETARAASFRVEFDLAEATRLARSYVVTLGAPDTAQRGLTVTEMVGPQAAASALDLQFGSAGTSAPPPPPRLLLDHLRRPECREPTKIFFAALDLFARDPAGEAYATWRDLAGDVFLSSRKQDGSIRAEYAFDWISEAGGDLYSTALAILTLSVEQR